MELPRLKDFKKRRKGRFCTERRLNKLSYLKEDAVENRVIIGSQCKSLFSPFLILTILMSLSVLLKINF